MGKLSRHGDTFAEETTPPGSLSKWFNEVAKVTYHIQPIDHDRDERYYTVKFGHVQDPNKFDTFAAAEAYINLIHSLKE